MQPFVQPLESRRRHWIFIAQTLNQLDHESARQRPIRKRPQRYRVGIRGPIRRNEEAIGQIVGCIARPLTADNEIGQTPQIFHQDNANCDGESPELADRQWLNALIGQHEAPKHLCFKAAIGMGDKCPGYFKDARISLERAFDEFRQLTVITGRQIVPDFANLFFRNVKIIDQPFGGGRYETLFFNDGGDDTISLKKRFVVVADPLRKRLPSFRLRTD